MAPQTLSQVLTPPLQLSATGIQPTFK